MPLRTDLDMFPSVVVLHLPASARAWYLFLGVKSLREFHAQSVDRNI